MPLTLVEIIARLRGETPFAKNVKSLPELISALEELDGLIEMKEAKESVSLQLQYLLLNEALDDQMMLHTVISGPPGVGKTRLGEILSRIWAALGVIKAVPPIDTPVMPIDENSRRGRRIREPPPSHLKFKVVSRVDFVGGYIGQTAIKTKALLDSSRGGVLFIDEAYSLMHDSMDYFGMEALTVLNQYMSEHASEIIIVFAGYLDLMSKTIFKHQPGLRRRCNWYFEVRGYTPNGLSLIFLDQMQKIGWGVDPEVDMVEFFTKHKKEFPSFGGDTNRFGFFCRLYHADVEFTNIAKTRKRRAVTSHKIGEVTLQVALEQYKKNRLKKEEVKSPPFGMYQ